MKNSLVVCGGTGAHVALAMLRLHTLGYAFGFFRPKGRERPLEFPTVYLVDQDSGDGAGEATAWQKVRRVRDTHPGRLNWRSAVGGPGPPELKTITPLPIGRERTWFQPPYDTLRQRFADSPYLASLTSRDQRDIRFSHGMMGSPAVGSLLFRLKQLDTRPGGGNFDGAYHTLLGEHGRVAVAGSAVGGTGASVGPTLADILADGGADVMAVMVLEWFRFGSDGLDDETAEAAQRRNRSMSENANSAFAYYGQTLARRAATVPVGIPPGAVISRDFTSNTQQPSCESFVHGVAALCCLHHYLAPEGFDPGLYQMGAEDPVRLGGRIRLPGGDTLQSLANQAATLASMLDIFAEVLDREYPRGWFDVVPAIYEHLEKSAAPRRIGEQVRTLAKEYRKHLNWMSTVLEVEPRPSHCLTPESLSRRELQRNRIGTDHGSKLAPEEHAALELFRWTADWVARRATTENGLQVEPTRNVGGGFWPELVGEDALNVSAESAGGLTKVADQNISETVRGFVRPEFVSENGWPHPIAAAEYFRYALEHRDPRARRQLASLLVGVMQGVLTLRDVGTRRSRSAGSSSGLSLDRLVDDYRKQSSEDFASLEVICRRANSEVVMGFNSPHTLLCPVPGDDADEGLASAWEELSRTITGSNQPEDWEADAVDRWRPASMAVRQVRTWIVDEKKQHGGVAPPWTHIFDSEAGFKRAAYGWGPRLSLNWGAADDPFTIQVALPTADAGEYPDGQNTDLIDEQALREKVPEIWKFRDGRVRFEITEFERPDSTELTRGIWREHLEKLQQRGTIGAFKASPDEKSLSIVTSDRRCEAVLDNIVVLDRDQIMVRTCTPMVQDSIPGMSSRSGHEKYPDYPLRSDYLGLVQLESGGNVLDLLKRCEPFFVPAPVIHNSRGGRSATWTLRLKGRSTAVPIKLPLPRRDDKPHKAHWMVWPCFRSLKRPHWRAYYLYEHCTDPRIHLRTLWLDSNSGSAHLRRSDASDQSGMRPIRFVAGGRREHTGGPPVAVSAENTTAGQELGLYVVQLNALSRSPDDRRVCVGIDFGTSHTVASVMADGKKKLVPLAAELENSNGNKLTLHLSENREHLTEPDQGLDRLSLWLPTYVRTTLPNAEGLVPSELLTIQPLKRMTASDVANWIPGRDCVIPVMDIRRGDLADHVLADFKWDVSFPAFRGHESSLREIYLGMVTELVMADIVGRQLRALPNERVDFTFTYPLRSSDREVAGYQETLRRVMDSGTRSLGITLGLTRDIGLYDESRAAKGGTRRFGEVCLVGDLGGGTLDLFISANRGPDTDFREVADSVRLGGNRLLRVIAEHPNRYLPNSGGWSGEVGETETKLRAWMRSLGSHRLFGPDADRAERHAGLNLSGFSQPSDSNEARALINRYFSLIEEYMSRSLVAFLARHWYPEVLRAGQDPHALCVDVQLRGNGWRIWHKTASYGQIQREVASNIDRRVRMLWANADLWPDSGASRFDPPNCRPGESMSEHSKSGPITEAVGKALAHEDVVTYRHALAELHLLRSGDALGPKLQPTRIRWFDRMPFDTGGGRKLQVEFRSVEPPLPLDPPGSSSPACIDDLETDLKKDINTEIQRLGAKDGVAFSVPIAALVWETALKSRRFLEG